jgi:uncharacterized protein involved in exopolysaccharide biosynthesis
LRDLDNAQRSYDSALQRYGQTQLEAQSTQTEIAVLNPAVPPLKPASPKLLLNLVLAVFLGGMLAVGMAFLMEMLDRRVRDPRDVTDLLGVPVLGVLGAAPARRSGRKRGA